MSLAVQPVEVGNFVYENIVVGNTLYVYPDCGHGNSVKLML